MVFSFEIDEWSKTEESQLLPNDKELIVIIQKFGNQIPEIVQFRRADHIFGKNNGDYLLCVDELLLYYERGVDLCNYGELTPSFLRMEQTSHWKSLNLPEAIDRKIKAKIESWFPEEE